MITSKEWSAMREADDSETTRAILADVERKLRDPDCKSLPLSVPLTAATVEGLTSAVCEAVLRALGVAGFKAAIDIEDSVDDVRNGEKTRTAVLTVTGVQ